MLANICGNWRAKLYPNQEPEQRRWMMAHQDMLDEGNIENLVLSLGSIDSPSPELAEKIRKDAAYFENNAKRMRYPGFRSEHLFVGSGVIEAGCRRNPAPLWPIHYWRAWIRKSIRKAQQVWSEEAGKRIACIDRGAVDLVAREEERINV